MSKLAELYSSLKKNNKDELYLFQSGSFYIFLNEDAEAISKIFNFKLTNLNNETIKCGFPKTSLGKYTKLLQIMGYNISIIDSNNNTISTLETFEINKCLLEIADKLIKADIDNLAVMEAYKLLQDLQNNAIKATQNKNKENNNE